MQGGIKVDNIGKENRNKQMLVLKKEYNIKNYKKTTHSYYCK